MKDNVSYFYVVFYLSHGRKGMVGFIRCLSFVLGKIGCFYKVMPWFGTNRQGIFKLENNTK